MLALAAVAARPIPAHFTAISASAASVCLVFALLLRWKALAKLEPIKPWLYLVAGIGFGVAFLNGWVRELGSSVGDIPVVGASALIIAAIVLAYIVLYDLWPKHQSNKTTEISALLLPSFAPFMPGAAGAALSQGIGWVAVTAAALLGKAFGV